MHLCACVCMIELCSGYVCVCTHANNTHAHSIAFVSWNGMCFMSILTFEEHTHTQEYSYNSTHTQTHTKHIHFVCLYTHAHMCRNVLMLLLLCNASDQSNNAGFCNCEMVLMCDPSTELGQLGKKRCCEIKTHARTHGTSAPHKTGRQRPARTAQYYWRVDRAYRAHNNTDKPITTATTS